LVAHPSIFQDNSEQKLVKISVKRLEKNVLQQYSFFLFFFSCTSKEKISFDINYLNIIENKKRKLMHIHTQKI